MLHLPTTSRAAIFMGPNLPMQLSSLPMPELASGEALVQIECSTLCGSDLHTIKGDRQEQCPSILGHESVGSIVAIGSPSPCAVDRSPLQIGERVTWSTTISCGQCDRCRASLTQKCRSLAKYGHALADGRQALCGGLAQYILLRAGSAIVRVPADLDAEIICPANCATATVAGAMRHARPNLHSRVLIFGAGMLGLTAAAMAKSLKVAKIVVVDRLSERLILASRFGADHTIPWDSDSVSRFNQAWSVKEPDGFDVVLEFSGSSQAVQASVDACAIGGRVVLVGTVMPTPSVALDPEFVVRRCMSIQGLHNYASQDLVEAIQFLSRERNNYPWHDLVERQFSLDEVNQAVEYAIASRPVRVAIRP